MTIKVWSQRGIALILVLWIVSLLAIAAVSFSLFTRSEVQAMTAYKEGMENKFLAEAGLRRAIAEILYRKANAGKPVLEEGSEIFQCDGTVYTMKLADGHYRIKITDESGKISLNSLTDQNTMMLKNLLLNRGIGDEPAAIVVDSILDWKDKDNVHRLNGAEDEYYLSLKTPYRARNGDFETLDELFMVRGLSPSLLLGGDRQKGMISHFTVYLKSDKINLNVAAPEVLRAIPGISNEMIESVLQYRALKEEEKVSSISSWLGPAFNAIAPYVTDRESNVYSIEAMGYRVSERRHYSLHAVVMIEGTQKYRFLNFKSPALFEP